MGIPCSLVLEIRSKHPERNPRLPDPDGNGEGHPYARAQQTDTDRLVVQVWRSSLQTTHCRKRQGGREREGLHGLGAQHLKVDSVWWTQIHRTDRVGLFLPVGQQGGLHALS